MPRALLLAAVAMIQLVLFDLGNTLVDYHRAPPSDAEKDAAGLRAMAKLLAQRGKPVAMEMLMARFYRPLEAIFAERDGKGQESALEPLLAALPGVDEADAELQRELLLAFHAETAELAVALPAADFLRRVTARGIHTALASNTALPGYCHDLTLHLPRDHEAENAEAIKWWSELLSGDPEALTDATCRALSDQSS